MKILFITPDFPYPPDSGGRIRIGAFLKNLASRHEVSLISYDRGTVQPEHISALKEFCSEVITVPLTKPQLPSNKRKYQLKSLISPLPYQYFSHYSLEMQAAIDDFVREHPVDIVNVELAQMGYFRLPSNAKWVLDQQNVEYEMFYRSYRNEKPSIRKLYNLVEWRKFKRDEINICRKFDLCLTTSERDRKVLAADLPSTRFAVVPNGVDCSYFDGIGHAPAGVHNILFTGTIDYYPNTDALTYFLGESWPLIKQQIPDATFYIVGKDPPPEIQRYASTPGIIVTGYVNNIREYFDKASVIVAPLRVGGGTRLKILEALSMRKPVVATSIGAEGLNVTSGENIILANTPESIASSVVALLKDESLRAKLAECGRKLVEEQYDWSHISAKLEEAYAGLLR